MVFRFGQALFRRQRKPLRGFLVVLDHAVPFGIAHAELQLGIGIALRREAVRQAFRDVPGRRDRLLIERQPGRGADQDADAEQQKQGLEGIEDPEAVLAVTAAQRRMQQQVTYAVVCMQGATANLVAPALWADPRHGAA